MFAGEAACLGRTNILWLLLLNLANKAKLELHLHNLFNFVFLIAKENIERNVFNTTQVDTVGIVPDAPFMTSYHERPSPDAHAVRHLLYGTSVVFYHKQVIPAVRVGVNG
jgi:hypothetical protein